MYNTKGVKLKNLSSMYKEFGKRVYPPIPLISTHRYNASIYIIVVQIKPCIALKILA
jgi:hypothetical protein